MSVDEIDSLRANFDDFFFNAALHFVDPIHVLIGTTLQLLFVTHGANAAQGLALRLQRLLEGNSDHIALVSIGHNLIALIDPGSHELFHVIESISFLAQTSLKVALVRSVVLRSLRHWDVTHFEFE